MSFYRCLIDCPAYQDLTPAEINVPLEAVIILTDKPVLMVSCAVSFDSAANDETRLVHVNGDGRFIAINCTFHDYTTSTGSDKSMFTWELRANEVLHCIQCVVSSNVETSIALCSDLVTLWLSLTSTWSITGIMALTQPP